MARENLITIIVGTTGTGKTTLQKRLLKVNTKKALVIDVTIREDWSEYKTIVPELLKYVQDDSYKVIVDDLEEIRETLTKYVKNTAIVFEDAAQYIGHGNASKYKRFFIQAKQKNNDLFFMFHQLSEVPKYFRQIAHVFLIHKTQDTEEVLNRYAEKEAIGNAHRKVMNDPNKYACEPVYLRQITKD